MWEQLILIEVLGTPDFIRRQRSFNNRESASLSSRFISGFRVMPLGKEFLLEKIDMASMEQENLINMDRGLEAFSLNLPSLRQSRTFCFWNSVSTVRKTSTTLSRSCLKRSNLGVPLGHSLIPDRATLHFHSAWEILEWETFSLGGTLWTLLLTGAKWFKLIRSADWEATLGGTSLAFN